MQSNQIFYTEAGNQFSGVTTKQLQQLFTTLDAEYGQHQLQLIEAAAYSFGMVTRVALGFSASSARVLCICSDSLTGWIALACARQLMNAGTECEIIAIADQNQLSPSWLELVKAFDQNNAPIQFIDNGDYSEVSKDQLQSYHLALCGLFSFNNKNDNTYSDLIDKCNEYQLPIHSILAPLGIDTETGQRQGIPLISSSTLSLGIPLTALNPAQEYVGRHYLCDISIPQKIYSELTGLSKPLFSEQPVVQIFPLNE